MEPPSHQLRVRVAAATAQLAASDDSMSEAGLEGLLEEIESELQTAASTPDLASDMGEEEAEDELAKLYAWAGLVSHAVARVYAPASPWPLSLGGWSVEITKRLQRLVHLLRQRLQPIAAALHAVNFSISVGFPWGVSIGVSF